MLGKGSCGGRRTTVRPTGATRACPHRRNNGSSTPSRPSSAASSPSRSSRTAVPKPTPSLLWRESREARR